MHVRPVIYLDVLLSVNLFINYFLLLTASKFLGVPYKKYRLLLGALVGAASSLMILLPPLPFLLERLLNLPISAAMVAAAYRRTAWRPFLKRLGCLYGVSFLFAGLMLAVSACFRPSGLLVQNGAIYAAVSPLVLLLATVFCYFAVSLLYRLTGRHHLQHTFCTVEIWRAEKRAQVTLKIDTGNSLTEPFSGLPVAVVERRAVEPLLPEGMGPAAENRGPLPATAGWDVRFRMVPFDTLSGGGLLPAFRPDRCVIRYGKAQIETDALYIGVSEQKLNGGAWQGLLPPAILSGDGGAQLCKAKGKSEADR